MAITLVQIGTVASGSNTVAPTFPNPTGAGNLLVACIAADGAALSLSASGWTNRAQGASSWHACDIFTIDNSSASTANPTFAFTGGTLPTNSFALLMEFTGVANPGTDKSSPNVGTVVTSPVTCTCSAADTASGELVVMAFFGTHSKAGTITSASTYNNGITAAGGANNDAVSTTVHYRFEYGFSTGNSVASSDSVSDSSKNINQLYATMATFKIGVVAPASRTPYRSVYRQMLAQFRRLENGLYTPRPGLWLPRREIVLANDLMLRSLG